MALCFYKLTAITVRRRCAYEHLYEHLAERMSTGLRARSIKKPAEQAVASRRRSLTQTTEPSALMRGAFGLTLRASYRLRFNARISIILSKGTPSLHRKGLHRSTERASIAPPKEPPSLHRKSLHRSLKRDSIAPPKEPPSLYRKGLHHTTERDSIALSKGTPSLYRKELHRSLKRDSIAPPKEPPSLHRKGLHHSTETFLSLHFITGATDLSTALHCDPTDRIFTDAVHKTYRPVPTKQNSLADANRAQSLSGSVGRA
jgi:hypothetical protein